MSQTVRPTELEKRDQAIVLCCCRLDFKLIFARSGCVQSKNGADLVEVRKYCKLEKTSGQTIQPKKIKTDGRKFFFLIGQDGGKTFSAHQEKLQTLIMAFKCSTLDTYPI